MKIFFCLIFIFAGPVMIVSYRNDCSPIGAREPSSPLAALYPNDRGIEKDPAVLFAEGFEDAVTDISRRYENVLNVEGMSLDPDVPEGSSGKYSLKITNTGGQNDGGHLFKIFKPGFDSVVFLRYYVKYPSSSKGYIHHEGIWFGGYNPVLDYPHPRAGSCGIDGRLSISYEPANDSLMGTYHYWTNMKSWNGGTGCYGNDMLFECPAKHTLDFDKWTCVEIRVKLNNPATASNGECTIWQNGTEVGNWGPGYPRGHWTRDRWTFNAADPPFEGFRWRNDPALNINYLWIEFYDDKSPNNVSHHIKYDNLVVATRYIGPIKK